MSEMDTVIVEPTVAESEWPSFGLMAVETIHQHYEVVADSPAQAEARLRAFLKDEAMVAPGIVSKKGGAERVRWLIRKGKSAKK